jgi:methyltransferase (TIGR00027 family)
VRDPFGILIGLSAAMPEAELRELSARPSESAATVAFCRALAHHDPCPERRGPDHLAEIFLPEERKKPLHDPAAHAWVIQNLVSPQLYAYFVARTAYIDAIFARALQRRVPQIVLLGAGYDTRAYRFAGRLQGTRVFELDRSPTQQHKRACLQAAHVAAADQLTYVSSDFKADNWVDALLDKGFAPRLDTLFVWEGVSYYLPSAAVEATLAALARSATPGSLLCADFMGEERFSMYAAEPFQFWLAAAMLPDLMARHGFSVRERLDAAELERRFLTAPGANAPWGASLPYFECLLAELQAK